LTGGNRTWWSGGADRSAGRSVGKTLVALPTPTWKDGGTDT
jgi:hypothetical protein